MSVEAKFNLKLEVDEVVDLNEDVATNPTTLHIVGATLGTLNASSTPPATVVWTDEIDLVAGTASIDLTALARPNLPTMDLTGLKVQIYELLPDPSNTAEVVIKPAAINGYDMFGDASGQVALFAGDKDLCKRNDTLPDVGASAKAIDFTSADADAKIKIGLVAG